MLSQNKNDLVCFLTNINRYKNPNDFILDVIFDKNRIPRKELQISSDLVDEDLENHLLKIFDTLEKIWKLGVIFNNPEISNNEVMKYEIDHGYLIESIVSKLET